MAPAENRTLLAPVFWIAAGLAGLTAAAAIFVARDLVYDGAYYLLGIAAHGTFQLFEPARLVPQLLQQGFAVAGTRIGIHDLWTLGVLFSLGTSGWPVILTALCWLVLPRGQKSWIAGPLLNLVLAIPATSFIGIGEGIIASCLLWLAFLLIEFRSRSTVGALASIAAAAACAFSHEAAILGLLVIALAAALQVRDAKGFCRAALFLAAAIALAGAGHMARWILFPRSAIERGDFLASMLGGFLGSPQAPNIPAVLSAVAVAGCIAAFVAGARRGRAAVIAAIVIFAVLLTVLAADPAQMIAPSRFFAARGLPVALTTLLMGLFLLLRRRGLTPARFATPPVLAVVLAVAVVQTAAQAVLTVEWSSYVGALRALVSTHTGGMTHGAAAKLLDPGGGRFRRELLESWSVEPLAILLAPGGHVYTFVEAAPKARWVPYDPRNPATLPRAPGLDWSSFVPHPAQ
jgi:hypothetical protein